MKKILKKYNNFILTDPEYFLSKNPKIFKPIFKILLIIEIIIAKLVPFIISKKIAYLFGNMKLSKNQIASSQKYFIKAHGHESTKIPAMLKTASHLYMTDNLEYDRFINSKFNIENIQNKLIDAILVWAWFETSHKNFTNMLNKKIDFLNENQLEQVNEIRLLPHHTSHLGHNGYLKNYLDFYAKVDPERIVGIWPEIAPNEFYLKKIIKNSKLIIQNFKGVPNKYFKNMQQIDSTMHSRLPDGNWRIEFGSGSFSGQIFPELNVGILEPLTITDEENLLAEYYLDKNSISKSKWFVVLHVREALKGSQVSIRAEDSNIENYRDFCHSVNELGGQVVRMGNKNFPKLADNFPAIDYAYSEFKSDFFDTWLWARCRWWTGNFNGASLPPLTFGTPRLITDAWPWDLNGPSSDVILPKLMLEENLKRPLTVTETLQNLLSRNTNKEIFYRNGLELRNNSSLELKLASEYMFSKTKISNVQSQISKKFQSNLAAELNVPFNSSQMSIPSFFQPTYFYDLS